MPVPYKAGGGVIATVGVAEELLLCLSRGGVEVPVPIRQR